MAAGAETENAWVVISGIIGLIIEIYSILVVLLYE